MGKGTLRKKVGIGENHMSPEAAAREKITDGFDRKTTTPRMERGPGLREGNLQSGGIIQELFKVKPERKGGVHVFLGLYY